MLPRTCALLVVVLSLGSACSGGDDAVDRCDVLADAVAADVLADDLVSPGVSAQALRDRLTTATAAAEAAAATGGDAATAWITIAETLDAVRAELAGVGFDLVAAAAVPESRGDGPVGDDDEVVVDDTAIDRYAGAAVSEARRLAALDATACDLDVATPGVIVLASGGVTGPTSLDPRSADLRTLPGDQLAAVIARSFGQDELDAILDRHQVVSVSDLADVLLAAPDDPLTVRTLGEVAARVAVDGPGDDESLDALYEACAEEGAVACDLLTSLAPLESTYARFGSTCGDRRGESSDPCGEADLS